MYVSDLSLDKDFLVPLLELLDPEDDGIINLHVCTVHQQYQSTFLLI